MTENQQNMLAVLQSALWNQKKELTEPVDWPGIVKELKSQTVWSLATETVPQEYQNPSERFQQGFMFLQLLRIQQLACSKLEKEGIAYAVMKGTAVGRFYPNPQYRSYGDIDILVAPDNFEKALTALTDIGFSICENEERHCLMVLDGVYFELHKRFSVGHENFAKEIDERLISALQHTVKQTVNGCSFASFPVVENGIVLALHVLQHLSEDGLGLRQIFDLLFYSLAEINDDNWEAEYQKAFAEYGLDAVITTVARMGQLWLGFPNHFCWCASANENDCEALLSQVLQDGNFGRGRDKSERGMMDFFSVPKKEMYEFLSVYGNLRWEKKHHTKLPKPCAACYQIGHYARQIVSGEKRSAVNENVFKARQRIELLNHMGISLKERSK